MEGGSRVVPNGRDVRSVDVAQAATNFTALLGSLGGVTACISLLPQRPVAPKNATLA